MAQETNKSAETNIIKTQSETKKFVSVKLKDILPWIYLAVIYVIFVVFFVHNVEHLMDSDETSELILGKLLSEEHGILSKNWYYSTELRFLNNQILFALLFTFFSSYKTVRILSTAILCLIELSGLYYFCRQAGIAKYFPYMASFLIIPFSLDYSEYVLMGLYYTPHIILSFFIMGLVLKTERLRTGEDSRKKYIIYLVIVGLLSLMAGMGGPRQILVLFIPLLLTLAIRWYIGRKAEYIGGWTAAVMGLVGYGINSFILPKIYSFMTWSQMDFQGFSITRISDILTGLLETMGYRYEAVFSYALISNGIVVLYVLLIVLYYIFICKNKEKTTDTERFTALFFIMALVTFILLYDMTTMDYKNRYALPVLLFALPLIGFSFSNHEWKKKTVTAGCILTLVISILAALPVFKAEKETEMTYSLRGIAQYLSESDLSTGYATYWNANILTELTDGKVDMVCFGETAFDRADVTDTFKWLQLKSHDGYVPEGRVFLILGDGEMTESPLALYLSTDDVTYKYGDLNLWEYESYEDMLCALSNYSMDMSMTDYLAGGEYIDGSWHMYPGALTRGPYTTMYPGSYCVTVKGSGLDNLDIASTCQYGEKVPGVDTDAEISVEKEDGHIKYYIQTYETICAFEIILQNNSSSDAVVDSIEVERTE